MKIFLGILSVLFWSGLSFLNTPLASDTNLRTTVSLHLLKTVTAGTDKETKEVDLWELLDGNVHLLGGALGTLLLVIFDRRTEVGVVLHGTIDKADAFIFELLTVANLPGVSPSTMGIISRRRGRRSAQTAISLRKRTSRDH